MASEVFEGKFDKGGKPYILHCLHVMNHVDPNDEELMCIAVLHDVIEDSNVTARDIAGLFSPRIAFAVDLLTHKKEDSYDDYIKNIARNKDAIKVKLADLEHNSNITRLKGLGKKDFDRLEKYARAYTYLKGAV